MASQDTSSNKITLYTILNELNTPDTFLASTAIQVQKGCCRITEAERFNTVLSSLVIHESRKNSIRQRYLELLHVFESRAFHFAFMFYLGHIIITVGSLIVPALLSVQYTTCVNENTQCDMYWLTWSVSLLVTTFNAVMVMFKVDKKYYSLHTTLERLRSEGWQYLQLTGRYSGSLMHHALPPTHDNQFRFFCHYVEKIKLRQIEDEYYKYDDPSNSITRPTYAPQVAATSKGNEIIYPPSLSKDIDTLAKNVPQTVSEVMQGLLIPSKVEKEGLDSVDASNASNVSPSLSNRTIKNIVVQ
jgi:hypothetical protein